MPTFFKEHVILPERTLSLPYTSIIQGRSPVVSRTGINRKLQGKQVREQFTNAVQSFTTDETLDYIYVTFRSAWDFLIDIDKFDKGNFRLSSYRQIVGINDEGDMHFCYEATVCLNKQAVKDFLKKIEAYINKNTIGGNPQNQSLIANIEQVRQAVITNFWQETNEPFPETDATVWWEVWLNRDAEDNESNPIGQFKELLDAAGVLIGQRLLKFPEHWVILMKGNATQIAASLLYTDRLAELRKPRDTADFFTSLDQQEQAVWIDDLRSRVDNYAEKSQISVCLLDTGVNITNPLLTDLIPEKHLDSINPNWAKADSHRFGHGTPMAGLIFYGDLSDNFASVGRIPVYHHLESVKLIEQRAPHDPELYGAVTQEAIARGVILNPTHKRIVCMAITSDALEHLGKPSSWSSAIDQSIFGTIDYPNDNTVFFVSSGNLLTLERINYPLSNEDYSIEDPAQAFNAITVGAFTEKNFIDQQVFPNSQPLSRKGGISPCNISSTGWNNEWCRKPDIVMEGGNSAVQNDNLIEPESLLLLSTGKGGIGKPWLTTFADTSAATALAAKFAAELYYFYPNLLPETIRALIIHSAKWTPEMLGNRAIEQLNEHEKKRLISNVGYGVPDINRAKFSANNSLSLIAERTLKPYKIEGSEVKTDEFHLIDLPFPSDILHDLMNTEVMLTVTLSYYIEPNPGTKNYDLAASYRSHGLRFKMIDRNESDDTFKARVSKAMRGAIYLSEGGEHWILSNKVRDKGSVHKDIWKGPAIDLSTRNKIAIYPVSGWWKTRKSKERYDHSIRYSLIVTIDTPDIDIDIYTPIANQIDIEILLS